MTKKNDILAEAFAAPVASRKKTDGLGENIIMGVAPAWIFCGRELERTADYVLLSPAGWIENITAPWPDAAVDRKKITRFSSIKKLKISVGAILWEAECSESIIGKIELDAVEGTR